ncbi:hypothetical protein AGMMS49949_02110 [Alphaproteobacteria bacterium]|nr:hypothetical protein AGMMS49949_02110 [Alphaproteobacteria bacterium]GHS95903.1 hypothetical protein AGMMS50296_1380 [Alphaproteobacteria bacterium]
MNKHSPFFFFLLTSVLLAPKQEGKAASETSKSAEVLALEQKVTQLSQTTQHLFKELFGTLGKYQQHLVHVGAATNRKDLYPATFYSTFLNLCQSLWAAKSAPEASFPVAFWQLLKEKLSLDNETNATLPSLLKRITSLVANKSPTVAEEISFLSGEKELRPTSCPFYENLRHMTKAILTALADPWREAVVFEAEPDNAKNIFSLAHKLEKKIKEGTITEEQKRVVLPLGNFHSGEATPPTLWGKVTLVQKIVSSVTKSIDENSNGSLPVHYFHFHNLLVGEKDSILRAFHETLAYLEGSAQAPHYSLENRLDALHVLWKETLAERLIRLSRHVAHSPFEAISAQEKLFKLENGIDSSWALLHLEPALQSELISQGVRGSYNPDTIMDKVMTLTNALLMPQIIFDDVRFENWLHFIGSTEDTSRKTLSGLLTLLSQNLNSATNLKSLLGNPENVAAPNKIDQTIYGIFNTLFLNCFNRADFFEHFDKTVQKFKEREDLSPELVEKLGFSEPERPNTLSARLSLFRTRLDQLIEQHHFSGADLVLESLYKFLPPLLDFVHKGVSEPAEEVFDLLNTAWWGEEGVFAPLNALIQTVNGASLQRLLRPQPLTFSQNPIQIRNLSTELDIINDSLQKKPFFAQKYPELTQLIGVPSPLFLTPLQTLNAKLSYFFDIMEKSLMFAPYEKIQLWYEKVAHPQGGLFAQFQKFFDVFHQLTETYQSGEEALSLLANTPATDSSQTLLGFLDFFIKENTSFLLSLLLDPYKIHEQKIPFPSQHSVLEDLRNMKKTLEKGEHIPILEDLKKIGTRLNNPWEPTVFGRLAAVEDMALESWNQEYALPFPAWFKSAEDFYNVLQESLKAPLSELSGRIGNLFSPRTERSLFGLLNNLMSQHVSVPLEHHLTLLSESIAENAQLLEKSSLPSEQRITLKRALAFGDLHLPLLSDNSLQKVVTEIRQHFPQVAPYLSFRQFQQLAERTNGMMQLLLDFKGDLQKSVMNTEPLLEKLGEGTASNLLDFRHPNTLFHQAHSFLIRLHTLYIALQKRNFPSSFQESLQRLTEQKNKILPGDCPHYFWTLSAQKILQTLLSVQSILDTMCENKDPAFLEKRVVAQKENPHFNAQKRQFLEKIQQDMALWKAPLQKAQRRSAALSDQADFIPLTDRTDHFQDMVRIFPHMEESVFHLSRHLGYPTTPPTKISLTQWNCAQFKDTLQALPLALQHISSSFLTFSTQFSRFQPLIPYNAEMGQLIGTLVFPLESFSSFLTQSAKSFRNAPSRRLFCEKCGNPGLLLQNLSSHTHELIVNVQAFSEKCLEEATKTPLRSTVALAQNDSKEGRLALLLVPEGNLEGPFSLQTKMEKIEVHTTSLIQSYARHSGTPSEGKIADNITAQMKKGDRINF